MIFLLKCVPTYTQTINDNFKYCSFDLDSPRLDIDNKNCHMTDYFKQKKVIEDFKILEQEEYEVYGDAYMCQQYIRSYKAHISIFGHRELETLVPDIDFYLSAQDC